MRPKASPVRLRWRESSSGRHEKRTQKQQSSDDDRNAAAAGCRAFDVADDGEGAEQGSAHGGHRIRHKDAVDPGIRPAEVSRPARLKTASSVPRLSNRSTKTKMISNRPRRRAPEMSSRPALGRAPHPATSAVPTRPSSGLPFHFPCLARRNSRSTRSDPCPSGYWPSRRPGTSRRLPRRRVCRHQPEWRVDEDESRPSSGRWCNRQVSRFAIQLPSSAKEKYSANPFFI